MIPVSLSKLRECPDNACYIFTFFKYPSKEKEGFGDRQRFCLSIEGHVTEMYYLDALRGYVEKFYNTFLCFF